MLALDKKKASRMDAALNHSLRIEALSGTAGIGEHLDELPSVLFIPLIDLLGKHGLRTRMVLQQVHDLPWKGVPPRYNTNLRSSIPEGMDVC